ncbi:MAG: carboxylesterase/lipase family protein [Gammaproteobacteria bacterium AqS3]|nr:carboxylesterase/lipase family protein [Gammaproteobacteria bacterium AqS3]
MTQTQNIVQAPCGRFQGFSDQGVEQFLGMRYAQPPVGEGRFRPPRPIAAHGDLIDATQFGDRNYQVGQPEMFNDLFDLPGGESEDCLFLNIFRPESVQAPLPVLIWIHGGAFIGGSGNQYNPANLVRQNDVIVVTFNYRLGIFGFINLAPLGADRAGSANLGLQDQIAALTWVRENIAAFGGDASNITVFGESAGAASVLALLASETAGGLFQRAMAFSGAETLAPPMPHLELLKPRLGVDSDRQVLDRLMGLSGQELTELQQTLRMYHGPALDGAVLTRRTCDAMQTGWASEVPIIIGSTRDEGTLLAPGFTEFEHEGLALLLGLSASIGLDDGSEYGAFLDERFAPSDLTGRVSQAWVDTFRSSALRVASTASQHGAGGWVYSFDVETEHELGTTHGSDVPFIFNLTREGRPVFLVHPPTESNIRLAGQWSQTLVEFARTGDPNGKGLPQWLPYEAPDFHCLRLSRTPELVSNPDGDMLKIYRVS